MNTITSQQEPITLKELSQHLNLSISTVSRVLNGQGKFRPSTVERIKSEAKRLNYFPNSNATGLKNKNCKRIGLILNPPISFSILVELDAIIASEQYVMTIAMAASNTEWSYAFSRLEKNGVDGVISIDMPINLEKRNILNLNRRDITEHSSKIVIQQFLQSIRF